MDLLTAPVKKSIRKSKYGQKKNIDLWEVNEAFSAVAMAVKDDFKIPLAKNKYLWSCHWGTL